MDEQSTHVDKPSVYEVDGGVVVYRASAFGGCSKALIAQRLGYSTAPTPKNVQGWYDAGHAAEEMVHDIRPLSNRQARVVFDVSRDIKIVGHVDGVSDMVDEVKSQSEDEWAKFEKDGWDSGYFPRYKWQTSVYMHVTGLPLRLIRYNRATKQIQESVVEAPWYTEAEIRARVLLIESQALGGVLPSACDSPSFPCPVFYLHEEVEAEYIEDEQVDVLVRQYKNAKTVEKIAKGKADESKRALRVKGTKAETSQSKVSFYPQRRLVSPTEYKPDEFSLEVEWENVRMTVKKKKGT